MCVCVRACVRAHVCVYVRAHVRESNPITDGGGTESKTILAKGGAEAVKWRLSHCPSKIDES